MAGKIRLGLVGAGAGATWANRAHFPLFPHHPDFELTAVCTTRPESAEAARARHGARLAFHDFRAMAASPEIDAVAVVVRVPSHEAPTRAAIEAGKHVYTEWPLGRTTAEAEALAALAEARGVRTAVGLQSRVSPPFLYLKELIESGHVGQVVSIRMTLMRDGVLERNSSRSWMGEDSAGAHTLSIPSGHGIDALRFVAGEIGRVSAVVATQCRQWRETDTGRTVAVDAPDNVLVSARMAGGAVASAHVGTIPWAGSGYRMEIYGSEGTLVATGPDSPQLCEVSLHGARRGNVLAPMAVPERFTLVPGTPPGEPFNIGQLYHLFARAIRTGAEDHPTFETAVRMHRIVDAIRRSSETGREVAIG